MPRRRAIDRGIVHDDNLPIAREIDVEFDRVRVLLGSEADVLDRFHGAAVQAKAVEAAAVEREGISLYVLMERAGAAVAQEV